jgi:crotonobetainyl-CoA:carnitine CoA-transferase CaiB-like acyl-CoA transferase
MIDVSQQETLWLQLGEAIVLASTEHREPDRMGNAEPGCSPSGVYSTADGQWLALTVVTDEEFEQVARTCRPALNSFASMTSGERIDNRESVDRALGSWIRERPLAQALGELRGSGFTRVEAVASNESLLQSGELAARELVDDDVAHPVTGLRSYLSIPVHVDGQPLRTRRPAAVFAAHTDEVLTEWAGFDADRIAKLRTTDVIGTVPSAAQR